MDLIQLVPRPDLSSTSYLLANPGNEYLVLQAEDNGKPFTVDLDAGSYAAEWFNIIDRQVQDGLPVKLNRSGGQDFQSPFEAASPCILYLKRTKV